MAQGHSFDLLRQTGLLNPRGYDAFYQRIVFPLSQNGHLVNLYGRSIGAAFAHRFLRGCKGGLYAWGKVRYCPEVILVEGLFDYAVLRQAGFHNVTCSLGTHLNDGQFRQLCDGRRTVYLTFDVDANQSGQQAAEQLAHRLGAHGVSTRRVLLPQGHDPNSFFVAGGDARQFHSLLEAAPAMKFRVIKQKAAPNTHSPIQVVEQDTGQGVGWINRYLDREYVRLLADKSLYSYGHGLLALRALVGERSSHRRHTENIH